MIGSTLTGSEGAEEASMITALEPLVFVPANGGITASGLAASASSSNSMLTMFDGTVAGALTQLVDSKGSARNRNGTGPALGK